MLIISDSPEQFVKWPDAWVGHRTHPIKVAATREADQVEVFDTPTGKLLVLGIFDSHEILKRVRDVGSSAFETGMTDIAFAPGSFYLAHVSAAGVQVQIPLGGTRPLFWTNGAAGLTLSSSEATVAAAAGSEIDRTRLTLQLLAPGIPWPLHFLSPWKGVESLVPSQRLSISSTGAVTTQTWWEPPEPTLRGAAGTESLLEAIASAIAVRQRSAPALGADLSGGVDSTAIAFKAYQQNNRLTTFAYDPIDEDNDDAQWSQIARSSMPNATHIRMGARELPRNFDPLPLGALDRPIQWYRAAALALSQAQRLAAGGVTDQLTGHGGDELFDVQPANCHSTLRRDPRVGIRHLRQNRLKWRWTLRDSLRAMLDSSSYHTWLAASATALTQPPGPSRTRNGSWGPDLYLPPWVTPDAAAALQLGWMEWLPQVNQQSGLRAQHALIAGAQRCGSIVSQLNGLTQGSSLTWHAPYLDNDVLHGALTLDLRDRSGGDLYKPPLTRVAEHIVPAQVRARATKADFSAEMYSGFEANRSRFRDLFNGASILHDLGIIDRHLLVRRLDGPKATVRHLMTLAPTLGVEEWLRAKRHESESLRHSVYGTGSSLPKSKTEARS